MARGFLDENAPPPPDLFGQHDPERLRERGQRGHSVHVLARIEKATPLALLLSDGPTSAWVPRSRVRQTAPGVFTMSAAMAEEKGFV